MLTRPVILIVDDEPDALTTMLDAMARRCSEIVDGDGDSILRSVVIRDRRTGAMETLRDHTLFVLIGAHPHTDWLAETVQRDDHGFIFTGDDAGGAGRAGPLRVRAGMMGCGPTEAACSCAEVIAGTGNKYMTLSNK